MNKRWLTAVTAASAATVAFGAAALAQTPSPSPGATGTPATTTTPGATGTVTAGATGTVVGSPVVTGTTVAVTPIPATVTPIPISRELYVPGGGPFPFAHPQMQRVWTRTDLPVARGQISRTWFWGPGPNTPGLLEQYNEAPGGGRQRLVQYFDKSRMEINNPGGDVSQPFFVTNGLLTVELVGGFIQVGENDFVRFHPACIPMTGDFGNTTAITYAALQGVANTQAEDNPAPNRVGQPITSTIDARGVIGVDASKATVPGVQAAQFISETQHNIPRVFWDFLNQQGGVVQVAPQAITAGTTVSATLAQPAQPVVTDTLISPWFFASGLPISEAYWTRAPIRGQVTDVLVQAFERRTLTFVPTNPPGWQVEMGNIGQHYFDWRYANLGYCVGQPVTTPTPPRPAPSGTVTPGTGTGTPAVTGTPGTPGATGTRTVTPAVTGTAVGTGTAVATGTVTAGASPSVSPTP